MDAGALRDAHDLVFACSTGPFRDPTDGWSADLIFAHLALESALMADAVRSALAGEAGRYDGAAAVDRPRLLGLVVDHGGFGGVLELARANARTLEELVASIPDGAPPRIADLVASHARAHLPTHVTQLRALAAWRARAG